MSKTRVLDMALLEEIVANDDKQRNSFNADKTMIRCNQGHSVAVDVELIRSDKNSGESNFEDSPLWC